MTALRATAGHSKRKLAVVGGLLAVAVFSVMLMTGLPSAFASDGGGSATLAELAARSPGARIGGIALKAKSKRKAPVALARSSAAPVPGGPAGLGTPIASVMSAGPVSPLGTTPSIFQPVPGEGAAPGLAVAPPALGGGFGGVPGGGGIIVGPGGGGGGAPGGGGSATPAPEPTGTPTPAPTPTPTVTPPVVIPSPTPTPTVPPVAAVPEPSTWLMLIAGFGFVGGAMRSRRRTRRIA